MATIPAVLVMLCTGGKHRADAPATPKWPLSYPNVTGNVLLLCVKVVSPGTCEIATDIS